MSFLDNLENNLKALESNEPSGLDEQRRREANKRDAVAAAPWAEKLKSSPWVGKFMGELTRAGFSRRTKINFAWIDRILRAEALDERLEIVPTPKGIDAVWAGQRVPVDLAGDPGPLIQKWLEVVDRKREERAALPVAEWDEEE